MTNGEDNLEEDEEGVNDRALVVARIMKRLMMRRMVVVMILMILMVTLVQKD